MSSIEPRTNAQGTTYRVRYRVNNQRRQKTFLTEDKARAWARILDAAGPDKAEAMLELPGTADVRTVAQQVAHYIEHQPGITEGTASDYRTYLKDLHNLAPIPISAVTADDIAVWVRWLGNGRPRRLAPKSIANRHGLVSAALTAAQRAGLIDANPAKGTRLPRALTEEMVFLTRVEFAALLDLIPPHYRPITMMLAGTGMRIGEVTALQWRHVNLEAQPATVRVAQAWKHTDNARPQLGPPKTRKSVRTLALPREVADELRARNRGPSVTHLYLTRRGTPVMPHGYRKDVWAKAATAFEAAHGKRPRVHDLRHSFVAWAIQDGHSLPVIQRHLGHESIQTTVDRYGHLVRSDMDAMATVATFPARASITG